MAIQGWKGKKHTQNPLYMWKCINKLLFTYDQTITFAPMDFTYPSRSKYDNRSQWVYFIKGLWIILIKISFFNMREFLNKIFYNLFLKIYIIAPIYHMFYVNHRWINMNFLKCTYFTKLWVLFSKIT
jgi:hypothetical protein